ncbi:carboxypeptidase-like regulatory domain-containing protein [Fulvivirga imtechensis]|nr:carboxypeptidase-like regulatory domain-containing protein [Fulvivirga imtechensis]
MSPRFDIICLLILISSGSFAQKRFVSGLVYDSVTREPIPYAGIGVEGGYQGTASNVNGVFEFIFDCEDTCSIKISCLGYFSKKVSADMPYDTIWLKPASKILKEVVVLSKEVNAYKIVKKAIRSIKKNYITDPFVMQAFYREYCQRSGTYTRLIEAAFDLYQPKGYRKRLYRDTTFNGKLKLVQTRRLFNQHDNGFHPPIAVRSALTADIVGSRGEMYALAMETTFTSPIMWSKQLLKDGYSFTLNKMSYLDGEEVFEIGFYKELYTRYDGIKAEHTGKLYISSKSFAILRYESNKGDENLNFITGVTRVDYKLFGKRYSLFRIEKSRRFGKDHVDHFEILNTRVTLGKSTDTYKNSITRADIAYSTYDPQFWDTYNVLTRNKLEQKIVEDLQQNSELKLNEHYFSEQELELKIYEEEQNNRKALDSLIRHNDALLCIAFYEYNGRFSLADQYQRAVDNIKRLKNAGVKFVFVSLDYNRHDWLTYIKKNDLEGEKHLRLGVDVKKEKYHLRRTIGMTQYQIYYKTRLIDGNVEPPYSKKFIEVINPYLEKISKRSEGAMSPGD